jgi:hypothetical protein
VVSALLVVSLLVAGLACSSLLVVVALETVVAELAVTLLGAATNLQAWLTLQSVHPTLPLKEKFEPLSS